MRKLLALTIVILGACKVASDPPGPPMPSARGSTADMGFDSVQIPPAACITRWYYATLDITIDCSSVFVDDDPHHYVTSCPVPASVNSVYYLHPPDTDEVELDAAGQLVHQVSSWDHPPNGNSSLEDTVYVYQADGHLQETTYTNEKGLWAHSVVTSRDARGQPLTVSTDKQPDELDGHTYPATTHIADVYGYDELGRLETAQFTFTAVNALFFDRTITYDDAARRRSYLTIVDFSAIDPTGGGPGDNHAYELLDNNDLVIEFGNTRPGESPFHVNYRYDDQGRLVSETHNGGWDPYHIYPLTKSYIYDCP